MHAPSGTGFVDERERIAELAGCARDLWRTLSEAETEEEQRAQPTVVKLVQLADIEAIAAAPGSWNAHPRSRALAD